MIANQALIVAHGQPSDPEPAEAALAEFATGVARHCHGFGVDAATLAAPGRLEAAVAQLADSAVIYPLFMARGWFVTTALPGRLTGPMPRILDPLGQDPDLPAVAARAIARAASARGWAMAETHVVLAAHGSGRSRRPAETARSFAAAIDRLQPAASVHVGFVEEPPGIAQAAGNLGDRAICLPFFAAAGGHALEDVPQALDEAGFAGVRLPVLGDLPGVHELVAAALKTALGR